MINKIYLHKAMELLKVIPLIIILGFYVNQNLKDFFNPSRDQDTYLKAVTEFIEGKNPYVWTILTYSNQEEYESELGYAYLSGFLFLLSPIYIFSVISNLSFEFLSKIPVLISDFLIGFLIYQKIYKHNYFAAIFGFFIWFVNPFFLIRGSYTHNDQIPTFFMLLSLIYLNKDSVKSGAFFALSILFKTFALVLFPIYLLLTKNKKDFILSGAIIGLFFSLPFMGSFENFYNYIYGSLFVHGSREIQGRPFLFYFSYWSDIEIFQIIPVSIYSYLAMFGSWAVILISYFFLKIKDKYLLGSIAALNFYLFTPVLNRTYLLWFFPLIIFGAFSLGRTKKMYFYYSVLVFYFAFYYFYLKDWGLGFHEVIPF
jgi:hypothetical protein